MLESREFGPFAFFSDCISACGMVATPLETVVAIHSIKSTSHFLKICFSVYSLYYVIKFLIDKVCELFVKFTR